MQYFHASAPRVSLHMAFLCGKVEGKKRWRVYRPSDEAAVLPRHSSPNLTDEQVGEPVLEVVLEPGDLLYFPRHVVFFISVQAHEPVLNLVENLVGMFRTVFVLAVLCSNLALFRICLGLLWGVSLVIASTVATIVFCCENILEASPCSLLVP